MPDKGMVAMDDSGKPVDNLDEYNELENALKGEKADPIPGDALTGEPIKPGEGDEDGKDKDKADKDEKDGDKGKKGDEPADVDPNADKGKDKGKDDKPTTPADGDGDGKDKGDKPADTIEQENILLRTQLREQRRKLAIMEAQMSRLVKRKATPAEAEDDDDDLDDSGKKKEEEESLSEIETLQAELDNVAESRSQALSDMLATMSLNPNYTDVEEVCTQSRFQDIFEAAATDLVSKEGGDPVAAQIAIELNVWKKSNPYLYMYDIIKKFHPDFVKVESNAASENNEDDKDKGKDKENDKDKSGDDKGTSKDKEKKPANAPLSALDLSRGGGGKNLGEWTAEKIDNLPESELSTVPDDIYQMYLSGEMDK